MARTDLKAALAVINALRTDAETAAVERLGVDGLVAGLVPILEDEQHHDGIEDCAQVSLTHALGTIAFMRDRLTLPLRRDIAAKLDEYIGCQSAHVDAATKALAYARALRHRLGDDE